MLSGRAFDIEDCTGILTIAQLKKKIEEKTGIPPHEQELILDTQVLVDHLSLRSVGVGEGTGLSLVRDDDPPPPLVDSSDDDTVADTIRPHTHEYYDYTLSGAPPRGVER